MLAEYSPEYTAKTTKHEGSIVLVGAVFPNTVLVQYNGLKNAEMYANILLDIMLPFSEEEMCLKWIFQYDNDPEQTSRLATK